MVKGAAALSLFDLVLVACDGSEASFRGLDIALRLVEGTDGRIEALGVEEPLPRFASTIAEVDEIVREREQLFVAILDEARARAAERGLEISLALRLGPAAQVIIHRAEDISATLIVVGHETHPVHDFALGSTAARVSRHAPCTVLIVR
jgi:nucleotide-binding universal stress UspA family protein